MRPIRIAALVLLAVAGVATVVSALASAGIPVFGDTLATDPYYLVEHGQGAFLLAVLASANVLLIFRRAGRGKVPTTAAMPGLWIVLAGAALLLASILPLHTDFVLKPGRYDDIDTLVTIRLIGGWVMIAATVCLAIGWIWLGVARLSRTRG